MLEDAARGHFVAGGGAAIDEHWITLIEEVEGAMERSWLENRFAPLRGSVRPFEVIRLRARARALELTEASKAVMEAPHTAEPRKEAERIGGLELRVASADGRIVGRIDRVRETPEGPVIQDYKTGAVYAESPSGAREVKPQHQLQLKMYAGLYHSAAGTWPHSLEIVPLVGEPEPVSYSPEESNALLEEASSLLDAVNGTIESDDPAAAARKLAHPAARVCGYCTYRPVCASYREADRGEGDDPPWPADLIGSLRGVQRLGNGQLLVVLTLANGEVARVRGVTAAPERHPVLADSVNGDEIGAFSLRRTRAPLMFVEGDYTVFYLLQSRVN